MSADGTPAHHSESAPVTEREPDPAMLRRAAEACRSAQSQMTGRVRWFDWVPEHLDRLASRIESEATDG